MLLRHAGVGAQQVLIHQRGVALLERATGLQRILKHP